MFKRKEFTLKEKIISFVAFVSIYGLFLYLKPSGNEIMCSRYEKAINNTYSGQVINKYIDSTQHNYHILILETPNGKKELDITWDISPLFSFIQKGDYIKKNSGSYNVMVVRGEEETIFTLDYGCDEAKK